MKEKRKNFWLKMTLIGLCTVAIMFGLSTGSVLAHEADPHPHAEGIKAIPSTVPPDDACRKTTPPGPCDTDHGRPEHGSLGNIGAKLSNPLGNVWALTMSYNMPQFKDGNANTGDPELGASMNFEPILPFPIFGTGAGEWRMVTRPVIPIIFTEPFPTGENEYDRKTGLGDIQLPLLYNLPENISGHFLMGAGPVGQFPTATDELLGSNQWALGPAVVFGYKTEKMTIGIFPNYFWKIGSSNQKKDQEDVNKGSMLYFFNYMLADAWQIGCNPTISYNDKAPTGNKWDVPVGFYVGKTTKLGKMPVNIKVGLEYSVISPDEFGQRAQFRIQITPVMPALVQDPIFGK
jgi:hypothetical protein